MRAIAAMFLVLALTDVSSAQKREPGGMVGAGTLSCARFAEHYRLNPEQNEDFYFSWAQGLMSGLNMANPRLRPPLPVRDLAAWTTERQKQFIRDYCDRHPLQLYTEAVIELIKSLPAIPP